MSLIGQRLTPEQGMADDLPAGAYWKNAEHVWFGLTPNGLLVTFGGLDVVEHADGTISATTPILVYGPSSGWEGTLIDRVWEASNG